MKKSLRKGSIYPYFSYANGGYSNNLVAENTTIEVIENVLTLAMDVGKNLRVKNKSSNQYLDAVELGDERRQLAYIQIDDEGVLSGLAEEWKRHGRPDIRLALLLDHYGTLVYGVSVSPKSGDHLVQFDVSAYLFE